MNFAKKFLQMAGLEPRITGVSSDRSTSFATATAYQAGVYKSSIWTSRMLWLESVKTACGSLIPTDLQSLVATSEHSYGRNEWTLD